MVLDTQLSLLTSMYNLLTADATLKAAMGGTVRLYPVQAGPDSTFPFIVHSIDISPSEPFPMRTGTYQVDIFSNTDNVSEALSVRQRLITLLDELTFTATEVQSCRVWLQTEGFIPDIEFGIWHYSLQFNLRWYRRSEVAAILAR